MATVSEQQVQALLQASLAEAIVPLQAQLNAALANLAHAQATAQAASSQPKRRKVLPPAKYAGENGIQVRYHIAALEGYFRALQLTDPDEQVLAAVELHTGDATSWWYNLAILGNHPETFEEYKTMLLDRFEGMDCELLAFTDLEGLKQVGTVESYIVQFESLAIQAKYNAERAEDNRHLKNKFLVGLKPAVRRHVITQKAATYETAKSAAMDMDTINYTNRRFEPDHKQGNSSRSYSGAVKSGASTSAGSSSSPMDLGAATTGRQSTTPKELGHGNKLRLPMANISKETEEDRRSKGLCMYCGAKGHAARNCKKRHADALALANKGQ